MALETPQAARRAAQSILSEARFHASSVPDPLHGVLVWVGRVVNDPLAAVGHLVHRIGSVFPGGVAGAWAAAAVLVVLATALMAVRRARTRLGRAESLATVPRLGPGDLKRAAERAEHEGRWEDAVRLRFRAGLLALAELDGADTEATPNRSLVARLGSPDFAQLARRFDEVAYGAEPATAADAEAQRRTWPEVLAGPRR